MNGYYSSIKFKFPLLKNGVEGRLDKIRLTKKSGVFKIDIENYLSDDLLIFLKNKINVDYQGVLLLYPPSLDPTPIHIDNKGMIDQASFNITLKGEGSEVNWFESKDPKYSGNETFNETGASIVRYEQSKMNKIYSSNLQGAVLLQGGIPHNVINPLRRRYTIAAKLRKKKSHIYPILYDDAVKLFQNQSECSLF